MLVLQIPQIFRFIRTVGALELGFFAAVELPMSVEATAVLVSSPTGMTNKSATSESLDARRMPVVHQTTEKILILDSRFPCVPIGCH